MFAQQDEKNKFIGKTISYHQGSEESISMTTDMQEKYDLTTNKNSKYLLYRHNDWIDSLGAEKIRMRHSSTINDDVVIKEIQKKTLSF